MALKTFTTADGSANQALVTNGSGVLSFAAVGASAGQVIQVVTATDQTTRTTTSSSFTLASSTLTLSITPSASANKVFVIVTTGIVGIQGHITIFRDSTNLGNGSNGMSYLNSDVYHAGAVSNLDSPNTTSAVTYEVRIRSDAGQVTTINTNSSKASITAFEIKG